MQKLEHKPRKTTEYGLSEIEDIIWEVDEDANGWIDWENFVQLYIRCRKDRTVAPPHSPRLLASRPRPRVRARAAQLLPATARAAAGAAWESRLLSTV